MSDTYQGGVRILGSDGVLLTTGSVSLETDPEHGNWRGILQTLAGTAVAGKAIALIVKSRRQASSSILPYTLSRRIRPESAC